MFRTTINGTTTTRTSRARAGRTKLRRGEIYWATLPLPRGRRPVLILTRTPAIASLNSVVVAPITTTLYSNASQLPLGSEEGLPRPCAANCDNIHTVEKRLIDKRRVGTLSPVKVRELDAALRFALQIR